MILVHAAAGKNTKTATEVRHKSKHRTIMHIKQFFLFGVWIALFPSVLFAQKKGQLEVVKDPLIGVLQHYRSAIAAGRDPGRSTSGEMADRSHLTRTVTRGFRVQIFLGPSRREAYAEQARFQQLFKNIDTYVTYEEPNYRVKVGDFRSRREAERLMQGLRDQFSNVFIFTEDIFVYQ